jgi:hypothetical protein
MNSVVVVRGGTLILDRIERLAGHPQSERSRMTTATS